MGGTKGGWWIAARTATATAIGGTASVVGGGKFSNGAVTSAFQQLFNQEATKAAQRAANEELVSFYRNYFKIAIADHVSEDYPEGHLVGKNGFAKAAVRYGEQASGVVSNTAIFDLLTGVDSPFATAALFLHGNNDGRTGVGQTNITDEQWASARGKVGSLYLFGCAIAQNQERMQEIANLTQATVYASRYFVNYDYRSGQINTQSPNVKTTAPDSVLMMRFDPK